MNENITQFSEKISQKISNMNLPKLLFDCSEQLQLGVWGFHEGSYGFVTAKIAEMLEPSFPKCDFYKYKTIFICKYDNAHYMMYVSDFSENNILRTLNLMVFS